MKIEMLIERDGYKNDTVKICEFLGFTDTEQLKEARFFSQEQSYSPIPVIGWSVSNNDCTWRLCKIVDGDNEYHTIDKGYKFRLEICDGVNQGGRLYYQCDFLSMLKKRFIIHVKDGSNAHIEHIKWAEELCDGVYIIHEADVIMEDN